MRLVLVTGPPGAGKTSLATPLAEILGFALISKDQIKEALDCALLPVERDLIWSRTLGAATFEALWTIAPYFDSLILECNFRQSQRKRILAICPTPVEVFCRCPADMATERYARRAKTRHPVHVQQELSPELVDEFRRPLNIGPVFIADTSQPVDAHQVANWVCKALAKVSTGSAKQQGS